jgi:hypothetical protein
MLDFESPCDVLSFFAMFTTNRVGKFIVLYAAFIKFSAKNRIFIATPAFHQHKGAFGIYALAGFGLSNDPAGGQSRSINVNDGS